MSSGTHYDAEYYRSHCGDRPYEKGDAHWEQFFGGIADNIVRSFSPKTVFDAGCAMGFLVEALWDRGVEAHGRDISPYAIDQVRPDVRGFCAVGTITDVIEGHYDLLTCIEVLEHLSAADADIAIQQMTEASDRILFSSTPTDFAEPTHLAVRPPIYWVRRFAGRGFRPVLGHDASYLSPQALVFERADAPIADDVLAGAAGLVAARVRSQELSAASASRARYAASLVERELERRFTALAHELEARRAEADAARAELRALESTRTLRYSRHARSVYQQLRRRARTPASMEAAPWTGDARYDLWLSQFDVVDSERRRLLETRLGGFDDQPLVSVIMPVYDTPERYLREAIDSVLAQIYPEWELCAVDDCSTAGWVPKVLDEYAAADERVRVIRRQVNGHISAASNTGLAEARGRWVVLLDHDDLLSEHALALGVLAAAARPDAGLIYSDEDKIDHAGRRSVPFFKPDFDPLLLLAQNYICHMTMVRSDLARAAGGFREGFEGSQDWDLVLRVSEQLLPDQVVHVPHVLYHWRVHPGSTASTLDAKPYAASAGRRAVADHVTRTGRGAEVTVNEATGVVRARWHLPDPAPRVSIVVPTRDGKYLSRCLESLFATTDYPDFEVILVDNGSVTPAAHEIFERYATAVTVVHDDRPFNYSALNNAAVAHCSGTILCLLNDDCELTEYGWLEEMVSQVLQDGVGVVGAKLLYPDGRIQHAGVVLGMGGVAGHPHRLSDRLAYGSFGWLRTPRFLSAVTAACMVVRRDVFEQLGGLDEEHLSIAFNDVDLCLRAGEAGWRVVWTPHAVLTHHESVSRGNDPVVRPREFRGEVAYMEQRWAHALRADPAYNPNLTLEHTDFSLAFPPRVPWWAPQIGDAPLSERG